ncbi:MAG: N-6 DNA methylase [Spirochaetaceae bacterium]|jgi:predicted helicase|nr:N-6 DNA methylase [Spirochaetaceae bacterium]
MNLYIEQYRAALRRVIDFGGSLNESSIRGCFINLVNWFAQKRNLQLVQELEYKTATGTVRPDGTLKDRFRFPCGYYEAKDPKDDLDKEIEEKQRKGYPFSNIIFENSQTAVLFQNNIKVLRIDMQNDADLEKILNRYLDFEPEEIVNFKNALAKFAEELPQLIEWCKDEITEAKNSNAVFIKKMNIFLAQCRKEVNADFSYEDVREILIQHILTDKLFSAVLSEGDFMKENNIARHINEITETFFTLEKRKQFEDKNRHFYAELSRTAAQIQNYRDKEGFLKTLYAEFYKAYNPKAADRLGVVYTPEEIVSFMIRSSDVLLDKHFNTGLAEEGVTIIDPACGTGTFITGIIDYITDLKKLRYKYQHEIFANEVGILPYYVANLNIEYTYWQKMRNNAALGVGYEVFSNIAYTDTLDNCFSVVDAHGQPVLEIMTAENSERIKKQNAAEISVVIGNPPYNANQKNYNEQNANRPYPKIDKRVRETFSAQSTAHKKNEDMYLRFYRWAMDRLDPKTGGLIAFITNRSFIDMINTDGFRASMESEFDFLYILDLEGDMQKGKGAAGNGNVFGITVGVAIMFAVKLPKDSKTTLHIQYYELEDAIPAKEKLSWLAQIDFSKIPFERVYPDAKHNWLHISKTGFDALLPVWETHKVKHGNIEKTALTADSLFHKCLPGIKTHRDDWVYDFSRDALEKKVKYFIAAYNKSVKNGEKDFSIKWSEELANYCEQKNKHLQYNENYIVNVLYRPFIKKYYYADPVLSDRLTQNHLDCITIKDNIYISFCGVGHNTHFCAIATKYISEIQTTEKSQCLPQYFLDQNGKQAYNIRDSSLTAFSARYKNDAITKEAIFHYLYAVFHYPSYRETYQHDLRRSRPRVPFYDDFFRFANAGKQLMELHINFENAEEYPLAINSAESFSLSGAQDRARLPKLETVKRQFKFDKKNLCIVLDDIIIPIPAETLEYKFYVRSAVEWIVDQYKKMSQDETAARLSAYDYADYKAEIISLAGKIVTVSLETQKILRELEKKASG